MSLPPHVTDDPGRVILRHALRVTVVGVVLVVLLGPVLHAWEAVGPAVFAVFTLGSFADFSGLPARRAARYLVVGAVAAAMLPLGTLAGQTALGAVLVTGLVAFATFFVGSLGGAWFSARFPVIIAFLYAATAPSWDTLGLRVLGWLAGTLLIALAALVLWPLRPAHAPRGWAGVACRQVAAVIEESGSQRAAAGEDLAQAVERMRAEAASAHLYPGAVASNERLVAEIVHLTDRCASVVLATPDREPVEPRLVPTMSVTLHRVAEVLDPPVGTARPRDEPDPLADELETLLRSAPPPAQADALLDDADDRYVAGGVLALARVTEHFERLLAGLAAPAVPDRRDRPSATLRAHLTLQSLWCRDAVRAAVALMLSMAVIAAGAGSGHAFWVALGTFSVLRADLISTGRSARATVVGTAAGFVIACGLVLVGERQPWVLWVALPVTMFLASWTGRFRPEVGAAAFTTFLVGMYALAAPDGLATAEARVLTVAIGAGVTLVVGAILWPRPGSAPLAALAQVLTDARQGLAEAVAAATSWTGQAGPSPAQPRPWASSLPVLTQLDRVLDTIATSAPGSVDVRTRRLVVAVVDVAVVTTQVVSAREDWLGGPGAASGLAHDRDLAEALASDADGTDLAVGALVERLRGGEQPSPVAAPQALARLVAARLDEAGPTGETAAAVRVSAGLRRLSALCDQPLPPPR